MYRILASMLLVLALAACGTPPTPQGALSVLTTSPDDGDGAVAPSVTVMATFSRAIDASTLSTRFTLSRDGAAVAGTVSYAQATRIARFTPESDLAVGTYTATIASGVRATDGGVLASDRSWSFDVVAAGPGEPPPTTDPDDPILIGDGLRAAFISPTPNQRTAGLVTIEVDLEAEEGIKRAEVYVDGDGGSGSVRVARWDDDPTAAPVTREALSASVSTFDFENGVYTLRVVLEDRTGNVIEHMLGVEFLTPFLITNPTDGDSVGKGSPLRQIVAVTIGVNGTIMDDYDVTSVDVYINGTLYAAAIPVDDDATSTRLIVYPWDTDDPGLGGHPTNLTGDRVITARVYFIDPATNVVRNEFTPGVIVDFQP